MGNVCFRGEGLSNILIDESQLQREIRSYNLWGCSQVASPIVLKFLTNFAHFNDCDRHLIRNSNYEETL